MESYTLYMAVVEGWKFMSLISKTYAMQLEQIRRFGQLDHLIRIKGTGNPEQLASRLGVSKRMVFKYISTMKRLGAPIKYCIFRCSYYYECDGQFKGFSFVEEKQVIRGSA